MYLEMGRRTAALSRRRVSVLGNYQENVRIEIDSSRSIGKTRDVAKAKRDVVKPAGDEPEHAPPRATNQDSKFGLRCISCI